MTSLRKEYFLIRISKEPLKTTKQKAKNNSYEAIVIKHGWDSLKTINPTYTESV